ncbi:uncharacterized protein LOC143019659 [Oratosquilla oratoria]|uniref:uncharacterized protein LOC143019659 n=1 Tax=Oratosquilla oratoria TaxID=337810 RepID=UPI003F76C507
MTDSVKMTVEKYIYLAILAGFVAVLCGGEVCQVTRSRIAITGSGGPDRFPEPTIDDEFDLNITLPSEVEVEEEEGEGLLTRKVNLTSEARVSSSADEVMNCPGPLDPANHTACCYNGGLAEEGDGGVEEEGYVTTVCCVPPPPPGIDSIFYIDDKLAMIIALSVTGICVILTVVIVICCFWSRCPLYTACRIRYHQEDIIAYASKEEEASGLQEMPPEEKKGVTIYSPNAVKVTLKDDV